MSDDKKIIRVHFRDTEQHADDTAVPPASLLYNACCVPPLLNNYAFTSIEHELDILLLATFITDALAAPHVEVKDHAARDISYVSVKLSLSSPPHHHDLLQGRPYTIQDVPTLFVMLTGTDPDNKELFNAEVTFYRSDGTTVAAIAQRRRPPES